MFVINAYIAFTALGCIAFWLVARKDARRNVTMPVPPAGEMRKAA